jgi:trehalose 6-phosphate phosphatase
MDVAELVTTLHPLLDGALIATDFDGTLSWLTRDPQDSRAIPGAVDALVALTERGARVAVITGRDALTVLELGRLHSVPGLSVAGMYGVETWTGGDLTSPPTPASVEALRERLPAVLADADPAIWIEDKRLSLVVHARRADDPDAALAGVQDELTALAEELGFEVHPGSQVLELRLPGFDKAGALARFIEAQRPRAVLWLGDDLGDLPAFAEVRRRRADGLDAWGVGVLSSGAAEVTTAADVLVADPPAAVDLLAALAR